MKIRTQLILAFLLLAIVPLSGIVLYSYYSSLRAVRRATEAEASALSREMNGRMASIRGELGRGVERMSDVPLQDLIMAARSNREGKADPLANQVLGQVVQGFGEAAPFLRSIEFIPDPPAAADAPAVAEAPEVPVPAAPPAPVPGRMVIDVPQILREVRKDVEAAPEEDPEALQAIDTALEALSSPGPGSGQAPKAPAPPVAVQIPDTEALQKEIRQRVQEQLAVQEEKREVMAQKLETLGKEREAAAARAEADGLLLGRDFEVPVRERGRVVGRVKAQVRGDEVVWRVLSRNRGEGEIPFAVDAQGKLHTVNAEDRKKIEALPIVPAVHREARSARWVLGDWAVATSKDPESGLIFGIARPVPLEEVRQAAAQNFGYGLGMIGLALLGILPISGRVTRNLKLVTDGADRIAQGDLDTRIPIQSKNEIGVLALTFNRMAEDLKRHQEREIEQALLQTEYDRKSRDLEEARSFQLSLLPKSLPEHPRYEIAVSMRTATEVGGDYYDFHLGEDGELTAAIGDATGHGARAGTMVTAVKSLFSAFAGQTGPRELLGESARAVKRMDLGRMAMGLCLTRLEGGTMTVSSAGMPPVLLYRAGTGRAEEVVLSGMPLGGLASEYEERGLQTASGDMILMMTDGLPELTNSEGDPLGYPRVRSLFESLGGKAPEEVLAGLTAAAESWSGGQPPKDDITFVVIRVR
jgi:serine phosphatase RsbU (regulator of sigma subunit)